jgi:DNA-binding transcriptional ArsR family regulator
VVARLLKEKDGDRYYKEVRIEDDPGALKGLLNETRWKIMRLLAERPRYPAEIADRLDMHEQNVYYHIRELADAGIIEVVDREERGGAVAKYYDVVADGFVLELPYGDTRMTDISMTAEPGYIRDFLRPFVMDGRITTRIVVGAPDPHGPHQVRARDAHLATDIGLFLGQYGSLSGRKTVLDVDVKAAEAFDGNMVLLGGPLTNMVTAKFNAHMPVKFRTEQFPFRELESVQSGETYTEDAVGFINTFPNPVDPESAVLAVAGVRMKGTTAAVLALTEFTDDVLGPYEDEDKWGTVVKGRDMDGDGEIDAIDVLE